MPWGRLNSGGCISVVPVGLDAICALVNDDGGVNMEEKCLLFAMFVLLFVSVSINSSYARIDPEAVVGIWLFEEGKGNVVEDSSGNGHEGQIFGSAKWVEGKFGEALDLTGGARADVPDHEALNFETDSFTVVLWFNFSAAQDWNRLVREREPNPWGSGNLGWEIQTEGVQIHWSLDDAAGNHQRTTYPGVGDGEWHHTAMIVNRDDKLLVSYMDGDNERSINIANIGSVTTTFPVIFGGGYSGYIDEVGIFKGVLDQEDIVDIMNLGLSETLGGTAVSPAGSLTTTWGEIRARS